VGQGMDRVLGLSVDTAGSAPVRLMSIGLGIDHPKGGVGRDQRSEDMTTRMLNLAGVVAVGFALCLAVSLAGLRSLQLTGDPDGSGRPECARGGGILPGHLLVFLGSGAGQERVPWNWTPWQRHLAEHQESGPVVTPDENG